MLVAISAPVIIEVLYWVREVSSQLGNRSRDENGVSNPESNLRRVKKKRLENKFLFESTIAFCASEDFRSPIA